MAANLGEAQRVQFKLVDATAQLPFEKESFDAILSIDAMNHLPNRLDVLRDLRTAGRMKVFIDGRADTVYDRETVERYNRVQRFNQGWQQVIESSGAEYILWPRDSRGRPLAELVQTGLWRILYDDAVSVLLVRSDRFPSQQLQQTPDSGHKRLALGMRSFEQQQYDLSEKELQKAIELLPASSFGCRLLMDVHIKQGRPDEAAEQGRRCQASFPVS
jgi:hypothetical protein